MFLRCCSALVPSGWFFVKSEELQKVLQEVGTVIYQQAAAEKAKQQPQQDQANQNATNETQNNKEKVVDSEDYKVQK